MRRFLRTCSHATATAPPTRDRDDRDDRDNGDGQSDRDDRYDEAQDTPPFGVGGVATDPGAAPAPATANPAAPFGVDTPSAAPAAPTTPAFEIRDRLIELDDLRRRGILSEEEFAAKKSELLNRI